MPHAPQNFVKNDMTRHTVGDEVEHLVKPYLVKDENLG